MRGKSEEYLIELRQRVSLVFIGNRMANKFPDRSANVCSPSCGFSKLHIAGEIPCKCYLRLLVSQRSAGGRSLISSEDEDDGGIEVRSSQLCICVIDDHGVRLLNSFWILK